MPLTNIPNQQLHFEVVPLDTCEPTDEHCVQIAQSDGTFCTQFQLEHCIDFTAGWEHTAPDDFWNVIPDSGGKSCHNIGSNSVMTWTPPAGVLPTYGNYCAFTIEISNCTAGAATIGFCGQNLYVDSNGVYTLYAYVTCGTPEITITPGTDFNGCCLLLQAVAYYIPPALSSWVNIYTTKGQLVPVQPYCITQSIHANVVTLCIQPSCLQAGCYYMEVCDPCEVLGVTWEQEFTFSDSGIDIWQYSDDCSYPTCVPLLDVAFTNPGLYIRATEIENTISENSFQLAIEYNQQQPECCYVIQVNFGFIGTDTGALPQCYFQFNVAKDGGCLYQVNDPIAFSTYEFTCCEPIQNLYFRQVVYNNDSKNSHWIINSIKVRPVNSCGSGLTCYTTNCFQVLAYNNLQGTKLVVGQSKTNTWQLGLYWNGTFQLKQRLRVTKHSPYYPTDGNTYVYSDGSKGITSAQRSKYYEFGFAQLEAIQHDVLSAQILTKQFTIDSTEYIVEPEDYKPQWETKSGHPRADVRLLAMEQGTIIFKSNEN